MAERIALNEGVEAAAALQSEQSARHALGTTASQNIGGGGGVARRRAIERRGKE